MLLYACSDFIVNDLADHALTLIHVEVSVKPAYADQFEGTKLLNALKQVSSNALKIPSHCFMDVS